MKLKDILKTDRWIYRWHYLSGRGKSFHPSDVTLEITYRCNLRCKMCLIFEEDKNYLREELSLSAWQKVIDEVALWHPRINITGGEPFLREDIVALVRYVKARGLRCSINTNGMIVSPDKAKELLNLRLDNLTFSIDGPEIIHDTIRGGEGAFKRMAENIRWIIKNRETIPRVWGICVITRENVDSLERLVDISKGLEVDGIQFQHVMFLDEENLRLYRDEVNMEGLSINNFERLNHGQEQVDVELLIKKIKEIKKKSKVLKFPVSFLPALRYHDISRYYKDLSWANSTRCLMPWTNITIAPSGDVFPCLRIKMGNVKGDSISSIWNGKEFVDVRRRIKEKGIFSRCRRCCHLGAF